MRNATFGPQVDAMFASYLKWMNWDQNPDSAVVTFGRQAEFFKDKHSLKLTAQIASYASDFMLTGEGAAELASMGALYSDDDPRIREFSFDEIVATHTYLNNLLMVRRAEQVSYFSTSILDKMLGSRHLLSQLSQSKLAVLSGPPDAALEEEIATIDKIMSEVRARAPGWWKEWRKKADRLGKSHR